jgi:hypothetical protein
VAIWKGLACAVALASLAACSGLPAPPAQARLALVAGEAATPLTVIASRPWNSNGLQVRAGQTYDFTVAQPDDWRDANLAADPETGWLPGQGFLPAILQPLSCLRRSPAHPWYALLGAVGEPPDDLEYFLIGRGGRSYQVTRDGRLYLFANDAPWASRYANNHGTVQVTIRRIN